MSERGGGGGGGGGVKGDVTSQKRICGLRKRGESSRIKREINWIQVEFI